MTAGVNRAGKKRGHEIVNNATLERHGRASYNPDAYIVCTASLLAK